MWKPALQIAKLVSFVRIKDDEGCGLRKLHSNLYRYQEHGEVVEFVANTESPVIGGYVVEVLGKAPEYMSKRMFNVTYVEKPAGN